MCSYYSRLKELVNREKIWHYLALLRGVKMIFERKEPALKGCMILSLSWLHTHITTLSLILDETQVCKLYWITIVMEIVHLKCVVVNATISKHTCMKGTHIGWTVHMNLPITGTISGILKMPSFVWVKPPIFHQQAASCI